MSRDAIRHRSQSRCRALSDADESAGQRDPLGEYPLFPTADLRAALNSGNVRNVSSDIATHNTLDLSRTGSKEGTKVAAGIAKEQRLFVPRPAAFKR